MALPPTQSAPRNPNYRGRNNDPYAHIRRNHRIKVPEIRVIGPDGRQAGVMPTDKALKIAIEAGFDLVEVAPQAQPPVCRIMDFGKYMYEESKKHTHQRSTSGKIKEIELSVRIENNDFLTKMRHAEEFLDKGNKVKLRLKFRGREMAHTEIGFDVVRRALKELESMGHPESEPKLAGRNIMLMLTPHPLNKRKRRFAEQPENPAAEPGHAAEPAHAAEPGH